MKTKTFVTVTLLAAMALTNCGVDFKSLRSGGTHNEGESLALLNQSKPNVVVILTDDLDVSTLDVARQYGLMPNLDAYITSRGVSFSQSFVTDSLCCPSRATFLTGQYAHNHGVLNVTKKKSGKTITEHGITYWLEASGGTKENNTLMTWMQKAGYRTGLIGKYLNGYGQDTAKTYIPPGYDAWHGLIDPTTYSMYNYEINDNGTVRTMGSDAWDYQTDALARRAATFIDVSSADSRPFFLWLTPPVPHVEKDYELSGADSRFNDSIRPPVRYTNLAQNIPVSLKSSVSEVTLTEKHPNLQRQPALTSTDKSYLVQQFRDRLGALKAIDDMIGVVVRRLKLRNEYDNTVLIFTADNGWMYGEHRITGKIWPYEESIRVPLIIASPSHTGRGTSSRLVLNNDLAPTIAELGGATPGVTVDGRSLVSLLQNPAASWSRQRFFVEHFIAAEVGSLKLPETFGAVREVTSSKNTLYTVFTNQAEKLTLDPAYVTFRESYDLAFDPTQEIGSNAVNSANDALISSLAGCALGSCQTVEDQR